MKTNLKSAEMGLVAVRSMRDTELLDMLYCELEGLQLVNGDYLAQPEHFAVRNSVDYALTMAGNIGDKFDNVSVHEITDDDEVEVAEAVRLLEHALDNFAPHGAYFGADKHGDYGYWPIELGSGRDIE